MSRILVINPNTSAEMTADIGETARAVAGDETDIVVERPARGPESLESFYEYALAAVAVCETVEAYRGDVDAVVVACYGDPGLYPVKELLEVPVVGVAEASMATATLLGHRFSILVALERAVAMMENLARQYGLQGRLASVEPTGLSVLELENDPDRTLAALTAAGEAAVEAGAEVFILGCSGMSGYAMELAEQLAAPVIDPVANAVVTAEGLARQRLVQSKRGLWRSPPDKPVRGSLPGDGFL